MPVVVVIERPKNRLYMGRVQHVLIKDPECIAWILWLLAVWTDPESYVWPFTMSMARTCFRKLLAMRGLSNSRLLLASLRAGAATHLYQTGLSIEQLAFKGRWKNLNTLHSYVQEAVASLVLLKLSPDVLSRLRDFHVSSQVLRKPPSCPLQQFLAR